VQDDIRLAQRIAQGDRHAFEEFVDGYGARVHRLVRRYVSHEADAEDVTQEIFLDLYRCINNFRGEATLSTWVYRVALNHCLRHRERTTPAVQSLDEMGHERGHEPHDSGGDPVRWAARRELCGQVHVALDDLSDVHRDVVILHELHGLTYRECAAILEVPVGTVKSRLSNAFRALRGSLGNYVLGEVPAPGPDTMGETA